MDDIQSFVQELIHELPEAGKMWPEELGPDSGRPMTLSAQRARLPETVYIELADYCNLNCMFCGREAEVRRTGHPGGYADLDKIKKLERPLRAAKYLGLSGRIGEPLIYPKLGEFLRWIYEINPTILLRITTNGTSLSRKMAGMLAGRLDFLAISLNAANAEAYVRDMRPVGNRQNDDWSRNWANLIRRITEFMEALPPDDRKRVFIIAPAHRDNLRDMLDFVRLVASVGCSRAVITPMAVHDESKIDLSIYWMKDEYNDVVDEALVLGTRLGISVDAARFYSAVKSDVDVATLCHDPVDVAYLTMEKLTAPCCHWVEDGIPAGDVYTDEDGFERFWNNETFQRLRVKRDSKSCKACGLTRAFDEVMFHFTPMLKAKLTAAGKIVDAEANNIYPDHELVRTCRTNGLDLPSLRRTVHSLGVSTERLYTIEKKGSAALPSLDRTCWEAFLATEPQLGPFDLPLAGCFAGIGWAPAQHDPASKRSTRWIAPGRVGSVFVRVKRGSSYELRVTANGVNSNELAAAVQLATGEHPLETRFSLHDDGTAIIAGDVSRAITRAFDGRIWLRISTPASLASSAAPAIAFTRIELLKLSTYEIISRRVERRTNELRKWAERHWSMVRSGVECTRLEVNRCIGIVKSDPMGCIPRIMRRLARLVARSR